MKYTYKQFLNDVRAEIEGIKLNATKEEIEGLNFHKFNPGIVNQCIYGQMTGSCKSDRAVELIEHCCKRYVRNEDFDCKKQSIPKSINGETIAVGLKRDREELTHLSTLESYILLDDAKNENVIAYIKGETSKLIL